MDFIDISKTEFSKIIRQKSTKIERISLNTERI